VIVTQFHSSFLCASRSKYSAKASITAHSTHNCVKRQNDGILSLEFILYQGLASTGGLDEHDNEPFGFHKFLE
jgi:hypothetical protein